MSFALKISTVAYSEIFAAIQWYEDQSGSLEVARHWHDGLMQAIDSLRSDPERYVIASESDAFPFEVRELLYGSGRRKTHRILFRIDGTDVEVLHIRHVAQDEISPDE